MEYLFRGFHLDDNGSKTITLNGNMSRKKEVKNKLISTLDSYELNAEQPLKNVAEWLISDGYIYGKDFADKIIDFCDEEIKRYDMLSDFASGKGMYDLSTKYIDMRNAVNKVKVNINQILMEIIGGQE